MDNAQASFLGGVSGTLVNVDSAAENSFIKTLTTGHAWIGASDKLSEGIWRWYNGDTPGTQFWSGVASGALVTGQFADWASGEPNDFGGSEDYTYMIGTALSPSQQWNDTTSVNTYSSIVEWTGAAFRAAQGVGGSVMENATAGTVVGTLATTDADAGETFTYTLVGGATSKFQIVGNQLRVNTGATFDFETTPVETVTVRVTDGAGNARDLTTTINVVNVNEAPTNTGVIASTNLISNGSFESGLTAWTTSGTAGAVTTGSFNGATAGSNALVFSNTGTPNDGVAHAIDFYHCRSDLHADLRL